MLTASGFLTACAQTGLTASSYAEDCLAEIAATEAGIKAWQHLDERQLRAAVQTADTADEPISARPLRGVPVGVKDIIDVEGMPCERGSAVFAGRRPEADAGLVTRLRDAGAVIFGKTVTTEFAYLEKSRTCNPHNLAFSPGGSSSGSAAAVAAGHIPLAIGTQTGGSVIRPASYCQVHALKPTHTAIAKTGVLQTSATLDQVGFFARSVGDIALLASVLAGTPAPAGLPMPAAAPRLLMWEGLYGEVVDSYVHDGLAEIAAALGAAVEVKPAPEAAVVRFQAAHKTIYDYEISQNLGPIADDHADKISQFAADAVSRGRLISAEDYTAAMATRDQARAYMATLFADYDGLLTASATGEAPLFENGTGNAACNTLWSLCGNPCLSLPLLSAASGSPRITGPNGLGVGLRLIGGLSQDAKILQTGYWLDARLM